MSLMDFVMLVLAFWLISFSVDLLVFIGLLRMFDRSTGGELTKLWKSRKGSSN